MALKLNSVKAWKNLTASLQIGKKESSPTIKKLIISYIKLLSRKIMQSADDMMG
jgi:hypothetical protein